MNPSTWSLRVWLSLLVILFAALGLNAIVYQALLAHSAPEVAIPETDHIIQLTLGVDGIQKIIYATPNEVMMLNFWLMTTFLTLVLALSLTVWQGVCLELRKRRALQSKRPPPRRRS